MENKLAIVIPYFKINFFEKTLQSIRNQKNKNFNLYIGNDGSFNNPIEIINSVLNDLPFKYFEYNENIGSLNLVLPWERLINETKNEPYLHVLGDDDFIEENFVSEFYRIIEQNENVHLIRFSGVLIDDEENKINKISRYPEVQNFEELSEKVFSGKIRSSLSENIFSREAYKKIGFRKYPLAWCSDTKLWLDICYENPIFSTHKSIVYTRKGATNISGDKKLNDIKNLSNLLFRLDSLEEDKLNENAKNNIQKELKYFIKRNKFVNLNILFKILINNHLNLFDKMIYLTFLIYKGVKYHSVYRKNKIGKLLSYYFLK